MRAIDNKFEELKDIVNSIYQNEFKIFKINSIDSNKLDTGIKNKYFISLGLTTSIYNINRVLEDLNKICSDNYSFELAKLKSRKLNISYLNSIDTTKPNLVQFKEPKPSNAISKDQAISILKELRNIDLPLSELTKNVSKAGKLNSIVNQLNHNDSWDNHYIVCDGDNYKLTHRFINYYNTGKGVEYRLGILVTIL